MKGRFYIIIVYIVLICPCRCQRGHTPMPIPNCSINDNKRSTTKSFEVYDINTCLYPILDSICVKVKSLPQFTHCDFAFDLECQNSSLNNKTEIIIGIIQDIWNNNNETMQMNVNSLFIPIGLLVNITFHLHQRSSHWLLLR